VLETRRGLGTFVAACPTLRQPGTEARTYRCSRRASRVIDGAPASHLPDDGRVLSPGVPALDRFPLRRWRRCLAHGAYAAGRQGLNHRNAAGSRALREAIAAHIGPSRRVTCTPEQIVVLSSCRQAFQILAQLLLDEGDPVLVEDPGFLEAVGTLQAQGNRVMPLPVDRDGADISAVDRAGREASKLAVTTPSHQYPCGALMAPHRRTALLDWAREQDAYIVEDDYDGEFWHCKHPASPLFSQCTSDRVIYVNSFSKSMFPALRLAYMVCPPHLVEPAKHLKSLLDGYVSMPLQAALQRFIVSGGFNAHLRDMRAHYAHNRRLLEHELQSRLSDSVSLVPSRSGLHLTALLRHGLADTEVVGHFRARGGGATALSDYHHSAARTTNGLVLGFSAWSGAELQSGAAGLAECVQAVARDAAA
jgi:GntR family transcriptional regulator/MocR family aminotransferase